jgi:hypothetical protein
LAHSGNDSAENVAPFSGLYESGAIKTTLVSASLLLSAANVALSAGVVHFERFGSDSRRTLLNKLGSILQSSILAEKFSSSKFVQFSTKTTNAHKSIMLFRTKKSRI